MTPGEKVGLLSPFRWVLDGLPAWLALLFGLFATIGLQAALATGVEGRVWRLSVQYKGIWPGDGFLTLALAAAVAATFYCLPAVTQGWWQAQWWHWTALGVGFGFVLLLKVAEIIATVTAPGKPGVYTWGQHLSPTMIGHTLIIPVMAYLVLTVGAAAMWSPTVPWWLKVFVVAGVVGWASCALVLDNILPRPDISLIHVSDGWWWQRPTFWRG